MKLQDFKQIKAGWLNGEGFSFDEKEIDWLIKKMQEFYPSTLKQPCFCPTPEGNIVIEWEFANECITLEINIITHSGYWNKVSYTTSECDEKDLDLDVSDDFIWVVQQIKDKSEDC